MCSSGIDMRFAKLFSPNGRPIDRPEAVECEIDWDDKTRVAQALSSVDGRTLAEMVNAHVVSVRTSGVRIAGMEPVGLRGDRCRHQEWHVTFADEEQP